MKRYNVHLRDLIIAGRAKPSFIELTAADVVCAALILSSLGVTARLLPAVHATTIPSVGGEPRAVSAGSRGDIQGRAG